MGARSANLYTAARVRQTWAAASARTGGLASGWADVGARHRASWPWRTARSGSSGPSPGGPWASGGPARPSG
eukprot:7874964-Alexandrium_andersonii.AAC.1